MKHIQNELVKQAESFVQEVCIKTWGMTKTEAKSYCLMIVKQNTLMATLNSDYLATAVAYATLAGITAEDIENLCTKGGETE